MPRPTKTKPTSTKPTKSVTARPSLRATKLLNRRALLGAAAVAVIIGVKVIFFSHAAAQDGVEVAFQANNGFLYTTGTLGYSQNTGNGMMTGTNPSIANVPGGYEAAFQANNGFLYTTGAYGYSHNTGYGMMAGTSPSITAVPGGYEVAFQANNGFLYTYGTLGTQYTGYGMMAGTSPSITAVNGGYEVAFQANNGFLYTYGTLSSQYLGYGMMAGTSPSITAVNSGSGFEIAFQANNGFLYTYGNAGTQYTGLGMMKGTSPSITGVAGGYEIAFQANNGFLYVNGALGSQNTGNGMMTGTSPSIVAVSGGTGYEAAFQANNGFLYTTGTYGYSQNTGNGMMTGTSPSIMDIPVTASPPSTPASPPVPGGPFGQVVGCNQWAGGTCLNWFYTGGGPNPLYADNGSYGPVAQGAAIPNFIYVDDFTPPCDAVPANAPVSQVLSCMNTLVSKIRSQNLGATIYAAVPTGAAVSTPITGATVSLFEWYPIYGARSTTPLTTSVTCGAQGYIIQKYFHGTVPIPAGSPVVSTFNQNWSDAINHCHAAVVAWY